MGYEALVNRNLVGLKQSLRRNKTALLGILFAVVLVNSLVTWHVLTEKTVYYWDYSYYWTSAVDLAHRFSSLPLVWNEVTKSLSTDYNYTPIILIALVMHIFGDSRLVYDLAILNLYVLPTIAIFIYLFSKAIKRQKRDSAFVISAFTLLLLLPSVLIPVLEGLPDIFGLLPVSVFLLVLHKTRAFSGFDSKVLPLGALLFFVLISRRWYVFWVVGAAVGLAATVIFILLQKRKWKLDKEFIRLLKWPVINGVLLLAVAISLLALLTPYVLEAYRTDYGDMYDAYRIGSKASSVNSAILYFGLSALLLSAAGYLLSFTNKKLKHMVSASVFFAVSAVTTFILFVSVQGFVAHHYYLMLPAIAYGLLVLVHSLLAVNSAHSRLISLCVVIFSVILAVYAFVAPIKYSKHLQYVAGQTWRPTVRNDIETLKLIVDDIESADEASTIYVTSSSNILNSEILANVNQPREPRNPKILEAASLDKRDGFPKNFFAADYVIVTTPAQVHLPTGQMVVTVLNEAVLAGKASNLSRVKTYTIDKNVKIFVYKRTAPYNQEFVDYMSSIFEKSYTGYPNLTNIREKSLTPNH